MFTLITAPRHRRAMRRDTSIRSLCRLAAAFTLLGPLAVGVLAPLMLLLGGPLGLLLYPVYFIFWLPSFYILLAPPFCLAGLIYAGALRYVPPMLIVALAAALAGFAAFIGLRLLLTGSAAIPTPVPLTFGTDAVSTLWVIVLVLVATVAVWWLILIRDRVTAMLRPRLWPRPLRLGADLLLVVLTLAAVGSALALSRPSPPKTAWDWCVDAEDRRDEIRDCSTVIDSADEPAERRLKALQNRIEASTQMAAVTHDAEAIAFFGQAIGDAETVQRLFGTDEHDTLTYSHLHRGQLRARAGDVGAAMADFDAVMRLDPAGLNGQQADLDRRRLLPGTGRTPEQPPPAAPPGP